MLVCTYVQAVVNMLTCMYVQVVDFYVQVVDLYVQVVVSMYSMLFIYTGCFVQDLR